MVVTKSNPVEVKETSVNSKELILKKLGNEKIIKQTDKMKEELVNIITNNSISKEDEAVISFLVEIVDGGKLLAEMIESYLNINPNKLAFYQLEYYNEFINWVEKTRNGEITKEKLVENVSELMDKTVYNEKYYKWRKSTESDNYFSFFLWSIVGVVKESMMEEKTKLLEKMRQNLKVNNIIVQADLVDYINKLIKLTPNVAKVFIKKYEKKPVAVYKKEDIPEELYWKIDNTKYSEEFLEKCSYVIVQEVNWKKDIYPIEDDKLEKTYERMENEILTKSYSYYYWKTPAFMARKPWITEMIKISKIFGYVNWKIEAPWWDTQDFTGDDYLALVKDEKWNVVEVYKIEAELNWNPAMYTEV